MPDGSRAGESAGAGGKIDGNPSFGAAGVALFCWCFARSLAFAALGLGACLARDKRRIAVELKGKTEKTKERSCKRGQGEKDEEERQD